MGSVHVYHRTRASGNEIACPGSRLRNTELFRLMTALDQAIVVRCDKSRANIIERSTRSIIIINTQSRIMNKQSAKVKIRANDYNEIKIQTASVAKFFTKEKRLCKVQKLEKPNENNPSQICLLYPSQDQPPVAGPINGTPSDHVPLTTCSQRDPENEP